MKFRRLELIRHRNGTAEFEVVAALSPEGMYVLRKVGESPLYSLADTLVDSMYRHLSCGEPSSSDPHVKQPEVVDEYEIDCWGDTAWTHVDSYVFPRGSDVRYTGRARKVVVQ